MLDTARINNRYKVGVVDWQRPLRLNAILAVSRGARGGLAYASLQDPPAPRFF